MYRNLLRLVFRAGPAVLLLITTAPAFSDGGMWTFHDFPGQLVQRRYH
ncbi:MAG: hypothetical protein JOZ89_09180, partial [Gammaproteobacteria bacterium]|nr:hypothetical protein [Gammaproteobacteria bacterium]